MSETIRVATIQPPVPDGEVGHVACVQRGLEFTHRAMEAGAKIVCLPECFGVFGVPADTWRRKTQEGDEVLAHLVELTSRKRAAVLYPSVESDGGRLFNTTWGIGPDGQVFGRYRKVHLTLDERRAKGLSAGDDFPVFTLFGLRFGIMTCYDAYFRESARILALKEAHVIFWPSLQRAATEEVIALQARSRALDNCVYLVRSSYGYPREVVWTPGMMVGASGVVDWEGRIVADLGHDEGFLIAEIPTGAPRPRRRSFEGEPESPRKYLFEDRRPKVYGLLCKRSKVGV